MVRLGEREKCAFLLMAEVPVQCCLALDWLQCFHIGGALQIFLCSIHLSARQSWLISGVQNGEGSQGSVLVATTHPVVMVGAELLSQQGTEGTCPPQPQ